MLRSLLPETPDRNLFENEYVSCHNQGVAKCVNPVNIVLMEPSCEDFGCSVETFGTDIAGAVIVVCETA